MIAMALFESHDTRRNPAENIAFGSNFLSTMVEKSAATNPAF